MKRFVCIALLAACAGPPKQDAKGEVDTSSPPSSPTALGKADGSSRAIAVDVQSAHPYANNLTKTYSVPLTSVPSCAQQARLHFNVLRTEAGYDRVTVVPTGEEFDGSHDDTWSEWFAISGASAKVTLETDGSITRHGFEIDRVEWDGQPAGCPQVRPMPCTAGFVDVQAEPGVCECPVLPMCDAIANVTVSHYQQTGRNRTTKTATGAVATFTHPGPTDGPVTDTIGSIDTEALGALVRRAAAAGLLQGPGYEHPDAVAPGATYDAFTIKTSDYEVQFIAGAGHHDAAIQQLVDDFEALFMCGGAASALSCGSGFTCEQGSCIAEQGCVCAAVVEPVCGTNSTTYGNACEAECASVDVAHDGTCGITGDACGTMRGLTCQDGYKCRFGASQFTYPFPDAGGSCVGATYCDAAADCEGLAHPAVLGGWTCAANACAWQAGVQWKATTFAFETPHPYANNVSVWYQVYLPAGAQAMRLRATSFATEASYDVLEVWAWTNGAWVKTRSYSGTQGPTLSDEILGRYFYLKFASDSSITKSGFAVFPEYR